jgi:diguanylate cyclase (GGDEF)-like protein
VPTRDHDTAHGARHDDASLRTKPRPVLLFIVYGVFLVIVGVTATAQVVLTSMHFSTAVLNHTVGTDAQVVRGYVNDKLSPADLAGPALTPARRDELATGLRTFTTRRGIVHAEIRRPDGTLLVASSPDDVRVAPSSGDWTTSLAGDVAVSLVEDGQSEAGTTNLGTPQLLREYFPLIRDGVVVGVVGVWRDGVPIVDALADVRRDVVIVTVTAALAAAFVLFIVFRSAQSRISRQTVALVEATRRDPLTGLLNHGALLETMAASTERLREEGRSMPIALLDIDNFRNLNDTWGHPAGDTAILAVARLLEDHVRAEWVIGRYGPDEFLVLGEGADEQALGRAIDDLRAALRDVDLRFADSERLPTTISGAVSSYPQHGSSVTELLATTALALGEAKTSGGDAVRFASAEPDVSPETRTFDVFQGLILAVDAKDRYTKRHSEDVARYAVFLGTQAGLPVDQLRVLRMAGLLHDVGKIGIPDQILRKPGKLTDVEYGIVQQHVALGDAIVRDLPDLDLIRAGIRHHHERWDGKGYLHRLEGEEIPLIARILSVCDTFSAMTTSRPYRKALDLEEALRRLEDASGTQLDESLAAAFVEGIRTHPYPPLPGDDASPRLWVPDAELPANVA